MSAAERQGNRLHERVPPPCSRTGASSLTRVHRCPFVVTIWCSHVGFLGWWPASGANARHQARPKAVA